MRQDRDVLAPYEEILPAEEGAEACEWAADAAEKNAAVDTDEEGDAMDAADVAVECEGVATVASAGAEAVERGCNHHGSIVAVLDESADAEYQEAIESLEKLSGIKEASAVR